MVTITIKTEAGRTYLRSRRKVGDRTKECKVRVDRVTKAQVAELQTLASMLDSAIAANVPLEPHQQNRLDYLNEGPFRELLTRSGLIDVRESVDYRTAAILQMLLDDEQGRVRAGEIKEVTYKKGVRVVRKFLRYLDSDQPDVKSVDRNVDVRHVTFNMVDGYRRYRQYKQNKPISSAYMKHEIKWLRYLFGLLDKRGFIPRNPATDVKVKSTTTHDNRVWLPAKLLNIVEAYLEKEKPNSWYIYWLLIRYTGCRKNEALQLRWGDVDLDHEIGVIDMPSPKTSRSTSRNSRRMPMYSGTPLRVHLARLKALYDPRPTDYVVRGVLNLDPYNRSKVSWENRNPATTLGRLIVKAGVAPWPKLMQNLRVTRENELLASGDYRAYAVHRWIGHSPKVFQDNYARIDEDVDFIPRSHLPKDPELLVHEPSGLLYVPSYVPQVDRYLG